MTALTARCEPQIGAALRGTAQRGFVNAARSRCHSFKRSYPPARDRYEGVRQTCIQKLKIPASVFTEFRGGTPPPDHIYAWFRDLANDISWSNERQNGMRLS